MSCLAITIRSVARLGQKILRSADFHGIPIPRHVACPDVLSSRTRMISPGQLPFLTLMMTDCYLQITLATGAERREGIACLSYLPRRLIAQTGRLMWQVGLQSTEITPLLSVGQLSTSILVFGMVLDSCPCQSRNRPKRFSRSFLYTSRWPLLPFPR